MHENQQSALQSHTKNLRQLETTSVNYSQGIRGNAVVRFNLWFSFAVVMGAKPHNPNHNHIEGFKWLLQLLG